MTKFFNLYGVFDGYKPQATIDCLKTMSMKIYILDMQLQDV